MTAWTADQGRMARPRAAVLTRVARLVAQLPVTAAAWADGRLSTGQVETICSFLTHATVEVFARHEHAIVPVLEPLRVAEVAAAMRAWRAHLDGPDPGPTAPSSLHASRTLAGRARVDGDLDADTGELLLTALRVAVQAAPDVEGEPVRVPAQRRADALGDICRFYLDHQNRVPQSHRHRPHLNLVFDMVPAPDGTGYAIADARTADGYPVDGVTAGRLLCDSVLYRVLARGKSAILDYGRATRAVPPPLWNVLLLRDQHCRWKGCDRPGAWCEAHHVIWWEHGGTTDIANLVLLCYRHHHIAHRPGWIAELAPDGTLHRHRPLGRHPHHPPTRHRPTPPYAA